MIKNIVPLSHSYPVFNWLSHLSYLKEKQFVVIDINTMAVSCWAGAQSMMQQQKQFSLSWYDNVMAFMGWYDGQSDTAR